MAISSLPEGTPYVKASYAPGEYATAMRAAVDACETPLVFFMDDGDITTVLEKTTLLDFLRSLIWDSDVAYCSIAEISEDVIVDQDNKNYQVALTGRGLQAHPFCANRLTLCDYISGGTLLRKASYCNIGGHQTDDWDLWKRMAAAGYRFKHVPEPTLLSRRVRRVEAGEEGNESFKATWFHQASYATTYYRCLVPARALPGLVIDYPHIVNIGTAEEPDIKFPEQTGAAIFQFPGDRGRAILMKALQQEGHKVFIEIDDNYFAGSPNNNPGWVWDMADTRLAHSLEAHQLMVPWVDGIITSTEEIAKVYRERNKNVHICPNSIDPADWQIEKPKDGILRIGWFASASHKDDPPLIKKACQWAGKQDGVEVVLMGLHPGWRDVRYTYIPWTNDHAVYRKMMGLLDVGLCPIMPTRWAVCRSDVKALEYAMGGAVPVMSDVASYAPWLNGFGCLKASTPNDWLNKIKYLVQNRQDVKALQTQAKEYVLEKRVISKTIDHWREAIGE